MLRSRKVRTRQEPGRGRRGPTREEEAPLRPWWRTGRGAQNGVAGDGERQLANGFGQPPFHPGLEFPGDLAFEVVAVGSARIAAEDLAVKLSQTGRRSCGPGDRNRRGGMRWGSQ